MLYIGTKNFLIGFLVTILAGVFLIAAAMAVRKAKRLLERRRAGGSGRRPKKGITAYRS